MTRKEIQKNLELLIWDLNIDKSKLYDLFVGKIDCIKSFDRKNLYARMLKYNDWYKLLTMIEMKQLKELLNLEIINRLFPKSLKENYYYVRKIIFTTR
ncbi:MAG: hypothetical protein U9R41_06140 [Candidatus Marinimicrobia bacterium]|nr:hypothetical protein [Candidatus Neomarinimicrobiota bacterium]